MTQTHPDELKKAEPIKDDEHTFAHHVGTFIIFAITTTATLGVKGYVLADLWNWFMVPTLSAPSISLIEAVGIALVTMILTFQLAALPIQTIKIDLQGKKFRMETPAEDTRVKVRKVIAPAFLWVLGWIVHSIDAAGYSF